MRYIYSILKLIYPWQMLLLVFAPIMVGVIIDVSLFDSRNIAINLIWIPLIMIPFLLTRKKWIYQIICGLYFMVGVIEISHWLILKGPITVTSLLVISNTNITESIDFFDLKATYGLLFILPYIYLLVISIKNPPKIILKKNDWVIYGGIILVSIVFIGENSYHSRLIRKGVPQFIKVGVLFFDKMATYQEIFKEQEPTKVAAKASLLSQKQLFVLVLGESCNRNHMSIYGNYLRTTNPLLEKRKDILIFDDVVSPYSNTLNSVLSIFTMSNLEKELSTENRIDVLDVFHSAGFKTFWISNQSPVGVWDNLVTSFAQKADVTTFVNTTSNESFEAIYNTSLDSKLFKPFNEALNDDAPQKLIVLHLMGNHASYAKRYPSDYNVFKGQKDKEELIAEYDNSILYNDFIVDSILNMVNDVTISSEIASVLYLSDHGENVYDELGKVGHDYVDKLPKSHVEIPFIVWLSSGYRNLNAAKTEQIKKNLHLPFVSDDLFHAVIDLNGIETPNLEKERSIFNTSFNSNRPRILEDERNYDD